MLAAALTAVPFPHYPDDDASQWYASADVIARHDPGWLAVAGLTPEALDAFRAAHPGRWVGTR